VALFISHLIEGQGTLETCGPEEIVAEALKRMNESDFSQLPVVKDQHVIGMLTNESILRSVVRFEKMPSELHVRDCMALKPKNRFEDDDFKDVLLDLEEESAVVILDKDKQPIGIVTDYDTAKYFRLKASNILLIEDIETILRDLILLSFRAADGGQDEEGLRDAIGVALAPDREETKFRKALSSYLASTGAPVPPEPSALAKAYTVLTEVVREEKKLKDLTMAEFAKMFLAESRWSTYHTVVTLDRTSIAKMLDEVRLIRNKVFHFRGDTTRDEEKSLETCRAWLQMQLGELLPAFSETEEEITTSIQLQTEAIDQAKQEPEVAVAVASEPDGTKVDLDVKRISKYAPWGRWLMGIPKEVETTWITFERLEHLLDSPLPASAFEHRSWWANDWNGHNHARLWLEEGWETDIVDLVRERVKFRRAGTPV